jgi:CHAT domain-containing protein
MHHFFARNRTLFGALWVVASAVSFENGAVAAVAVSAPREGALVVDVNPVLPAARAGVRKGDRIVAVREGRRWIPIRDGFDAMAAAYRLAWLGPFALRLNRGGALIEMAIGPDDWGLRFGPDLSPRSLPEYVADPATPANLAAYCDALETIATATQLEMPNGPRRAAQVRWRCVEAAMEVQAWPRVTQLLPVIHRVLESDADALLATWLTVAEMAERGNALEILSLAAEQAESLAPKTKDPATSTLQATVPKLWSDYFANRHVAALELAQQGLDACKQGCAGSLLEARLRTLKARSLRKLERLDVAEREYLSALAIHQKWAPQAFDTARARNNYAMLLRAKGNSTAAFDEQTAAVGITRRNAPQSLQLAAMLNNLGLIAWDRGDFTRAQTVYDEALAIQRHWAPDGFAMAVTMQNLAYIALDREENGLAESLSSRSAAIFDRVAPNNDSVPIAVNLHGLVLERQGNLDAADAEYRRANALWEKVAPGSARHAWSVHNLGGNAEKRGNLVLAQQQFEASLAMRTKIAPGSQDEAHDRVSLADVQRKQGHLDDALSGFREAVAAYERVAPQARDHARALHGLGLTLWQQEKIRDAVAPLCAAERVLDAQRRRVSPSRESQAEFAAQYSDIPRDCAVACIETGNIASAFAVIERGRARALRERMLFRDDALAAATVPEALRQQRGELFQRRARWEGALASLHRDAAGEERERLGARLSEVVQAEDAWLRELEKSAPRYARELREPVLDLGDIEKKLPDDAAVLMYLLAEKRSYVLRLSGKDRRLTVSTIEFGRAAIDAQVKELRERVQRREPMQTLGPELRAAYDRLLAPAADTIGAAKRLLIVPDGSLSLLPFSALRDAEGRYVVQRWKLGIAPSLSVAMEDVGKQQPRGALSILAVAVPQSHGLTSGEKGALLPRLPGAEKEAIAAAAAYGKHGTLLIDPAAGEEAVRRGARQAQVLHIAAHGYFDSRHPVDSALFLSEANAANPADDGVVHAWEVMADWQLERTSLVLLSACDTGVGGLLTDEGLIGLTRAFQYAGARRVIATLWPITDEPTARLMRRLHGDIALGSSPSAALRNAQIAELTDSSETEVSALRGVGGLATASQPGANRGHPYYWAGFEMFGSMP